MVNCLICIEIFESLSIGTVECSDPGEDNLAWGHKWSNIRI